MRGMEAAAFFVAFLVSLRLMWCQGLMEDLDVRKTLSQHAEYVITSWTIPLRGSRCSNRQQII